MEDYIGMLGIFGGNFAPRYFAFCDGRILPIASYTPLYSLIGSTYGGNGVTTFALPDLRGRVPVGFGGGPGLSFYNIGEIGGSATAYVSPNQLPSHNHSFAVSAAAATQSTATANASIAAPNIPAGRGTSPSNGFTASTPNMYLMPQAVSNAGSSVPHNNLQPYLGVNYIICLSGYYPARN